MESITSHHRQSMGNPRMSLLPSKQPIQPPTLATPQFDSEELLARINTFNTDFNQAIQSAKKKIVENSEQWTHHSGQLRDKDRLLQEQYEKAAADEVNLDRTLKKEKEELTEITRVVQEMETRRDDIQQTKSLLEAQVAALRKEVKAKREAKIAMKHALDEQSLKNKPELATYESILSMRIVGVKEDHTAFVFTRINEQDWEKEYTITMDVSRQAFAVSNCSPKIPELDSLLAYLNDTRDFYGFLKKVRMAFKELSKNAS